MLGGRVVFLLALLLLLLAPGVHAGDQHAVGWRRPWDHTFLKGLSKDLHDLEAVPPIKAGMALLGGFCGAAMGVATGTSTMASSATDPELQDGAGHLMAGAAAGWVVGWTFDEFRCLQGEWSNEERAELAVAGFQRGMVLGAVAGSMGQLFSGSSDEDGPSAFVTSSSTSSGGGGAQDAKSDEPTALEKLGSGTSSGNMALLHNAIAGALAGASVGYILPEVCTIAEVVGKTVLQAADEGRALHAEVAEKVGKLEAVQDLKRGRQKVENFANDALAQLSPSESDQSASELVALKATARVAFKYDPLLAALVDKMRVQDMGSVGKILAKQELTPQQLQVLAILLDTTPEALGASVVKFAKVGVVVAEQPKAKKKKGSLGFLTKAGDLVKTAASRARDTVKGLLLRDPNADLTVEALGVFKEAAKQIVADAALNDPAIDKIIAGLVLGGQELSQKAVQDLAKSLDMTDEDLKKGLERLRASPAKEKLLAKFVELAKPSLEEAGGNDDEEPVGEEEQRTGEQPFAKDGIE